MDEARFTKRLRHAALCAVVASVFWWLTVLVYYMTDGDLPDSGFATAILIGWIYGLAYPPMVAKTDKE